MKPFKHKLVDWVLNHNENWAIFGVDHTEN
jgi:hypothetical protein